MKKLTDQEMKEVQELRTILYEIISTSGELHLSKVVLQKQVAEIEAEMKKQESRFAEFQHKEKVIFERLQNKYGTGNINMDTGEVTE